jgi:predicted anti-sigma-YlaC factor YlaD
VSGRSWGWVFQSDPDGGYVDGGAPDVVAFVVAGGNGAVLLGQGEASLDGVAVGIGLFVEHWWPSAVAAALGPVADLVGAFGDDGLDAPAA